MPLSGPLQGGVSGQTQLVLRWPLRTVGVGTVCCSHSLVRVYSRARRMCPFPSAAGPVQAWGWPGSIRPGAPLSPMSTGLWDSASRQSSVPACLPGPWPPAMLRGRGRGVLPWGARLGSAGSLVLGRDFFRSEGLANQGDPGVSCCPGSLSSRSTRVPSACPEAESALCSSQCEYSGGQLPLSWGPPHRWPVLWAFPSVSVCTEAGRTFPLHPCP